MPWSDRLRTARSPHLSLRSPAATSPTFVGNLRLVPVTARGRAARCPACGKRRDVDKQRALRKVEDAWRARQASRLAPDSPFYPREGHMRQLALSDDSRWFWACDACVRSGRAVVADPMKQTLGLGSPFAAYVDRPFRCEDCGTNSVFSAREQQHWFENLRFLIWVYPKQCLPCRAARRHRVRTNEALAKALHGLDPSDPAQLESVAHLYEELGRSHKADEYQARAKNRRRAVEDDPQ